MVREIPLLDGTTVDADQVVSLHPEVGGDRGEKRVLDASEHFLAGELPPWLGFESDAPDVEEPTVADDGSVTLDAGSATAGHVARLTTTFDLDRSEWRRAHCYVVGFTCSAGATGLPLAWADDPDPARSTDGFHHAVGDGESRQAIRADGETVREQHLTVADRSDRHTYGWRLLSNPGWEGHTIYWEVDALPYDGFAAAQGFPAPGSRPLSVGVRSDSNGEPATCSVENVYVELVSRD